MPYDFTQNWCQSFQANADRLLGDCSHLPLQCLEVGVFEGRSACWVLDHIATHPDAHFTGIDDWSQDPSAKKRAKANLARHGCKQSLIESDSESALSVLTKTSGIESFDIIYIDGDHNTSPCFRDSMLAWPLLKKNGIMIWDDYGSEGVRSAIDAFLASLDGQYSIMASNWQLWVRKKPQCREIMHPANWPFSWDGIPGLLTEYRAGFLCGERCAARAVSMLRSGHAVLSLSDSDIAIWGYDELLTIDGVQRKWLDSLARLSGLNHEDRSQFMPTINRALLDTPCWFMQFNWPIVEVLTHAVCR